MKQRSTFQQKIIRNYYQNRDDIAIQSLGEVVSELYLCTNDRKRIQLWKRAETALKGIGAPPAEVARILKAHDLAALAKFVSRTF
jgi:hypothetical protein